MSIVRLKMTIFKEERPSDTPILISDQKATLINIEMYQVDAAMARRTGHPAANESAAEGIASGIALQP